MKKKLPAGICRGDMRIEFFEDEGELYMMRDGISTEYANFPDDIYNFLYQLFLNEELIITRNIKKQFPNNIKEQVKAYTIWHFGSFDNVPDVDENFTIVNYEKQINFDLLGKREVQILQLADKGLTSKQIAEQLFIAENTVKTHFQNITNKLEASNIREACYIAKNNNLI